MLDWIENLTNALPDASAWRLVRRILIRATFEEAWHYGLGALIIWAVLHLALKRYLSGRLISKWPRPADILREIQYSISTVIVFGGLNVLLLALIITNRVEIYSDPLQHGAVWLTVSLPILIVWQDFHFYWTHRLLHTRWLFRNVHAVHHRSRQPSPFAAYSFHPIEAVNNSLGLISALMAVPVNEVVLSIFLVHQIVRSTHGHAAVETMQHGFTQSKFWGHFITTTHHHMHHENPRGNFGLWFTWLDRIFGTEHHDYFERFDAITQPRTNDTRVENKSSPRIDI